MFSTEALTILIFLLPGFVVQLVVTTLYPGRDKDKLRFFIKSLGYTLIIQLLSQSTLAPVAQDFTFLFQINNGMLPVKIRIDSFIISIILGLAVSYSIRFDIIMSLLRLVKVTEKTSLSCTWEDVFIGESRFVTVTFTDGIRITGTIRHYSDDKSEGMISLANAYWINNNRHERIDVDYVLIPNISDIRSIEFHHPRRSNDDTGQRESEAKPRPHFRRRKKTCPISNPATTNNSCTSET